MPWICTTVQQGHGRRLSSVWRAVIWQLHRSAALPYSQGVGWWALTPMSLICTTVQQGCGRRRSSAWLEVILQLHLLELWPCSQGVSTEVRLLHSPEWDVNVLPSLAPFFAAASCLTCNTTGVTNTVDVYNSVTKTWSTDQLSVSRNYPAATSVGGVAIFAGGGYLSSCFNNVDLYDISKELWSTAQLSSARSNPAATSVGNVAMFAGGSCTNCAL